MSVKPTTLDDESPTTITPGEEKEKKRCQEPIIDGCAGRTIGNLMVWPQRDGELSRFAGWLTLTRTQRWHVHRHSTGSGHVYQGRFKSFPIQADEHLYTVARHVERNAFANLVGRAEE